MNIKMRDIKFRAKTLIKGDLIEGLTIVRGSIKRKRNNYYFEISPEKYVQVIPESISQYTGLEDKNGIKIFEGDTVSMQHGLYKYKVSFETGSFVLYHLTAKDLVNGGPLKWGLLSRSFELGEDYEIEILDNNE